MTRMPRAVTMRPEIPTRNRRCNDAGNIGDELHRRIADVEGRETSGARRMPSGSSLRGKTGSAQLRPCSVGPRRGIRRPSDPVIPASQANKTGVPASTSPMLTSGPRMPSRSVHSHAPTATTYVYQVTPEILGRRRATQHPPVRPAGRQKVKESAVAGPRTYRPRRTPPPTPDDSVTEKVKCAGPGGPPVGQPWWVRVSDELKRRSLGLCGLPRCFAA